MYKKTVSENNQSYVNRESGNNSVTRKSISTMDFKRKALKVQPEEKKASKEFVRRKRNVFETTVIAVPTKVPKVDQSKKLQQPKVKPETQKVKETQDDKSPFILTVPVGKYVESRKRGLLYWSELNDARKRRNLEPSSIQTPGKGDKPTIARNHLTLVEEEMKSKIKVDEFLAKFMKAEPKTDANEKELLSIPPPDIVQETKIIEEGPKGLDQLLIETKSVDAMDALKSPKDSRRNLPKIEAKLKEALNQSVIESGLDFHWFWRIVLEFYFYHFLIIYMVCTFCFGWIFKRPKLTR